jgi:predicted ATPase
MEHAHRMLQFQPDDTPATRFDKLERLLSAYSRPLDEAAPLYAAWLSVPVPEGRYPDDMLRAIASEGEASLQTKLAQLVEAELVYQRGRPPRSTYMFKHALIQDAAYAFLLKSTRQYIHRRIADSLETTFHTLTVTHPELVAHHYTAAGCYPQAVAYWYQAGRLASQQLAHAEAIAHLTKGLEVLQELPETDERHRQELDLQLALGRSLLTIKGLGAADAEGPYRRTLELCQHIEAPAQQLAALAGLRRLASARGDIQAARDVAEQLLGLAQRQQDTPLLLEALYSLGIALKQLGGFRAALTQFKQGIARDQHPGLETPTNLPWVG